MKELTAEAQRRADWIVSRYPVRQAAMLPILYLLQEVYGSVSDEAITHAAKLLQVPPATVYGVLSFYTLFKRPWEGKHTIWVCSTLSCALAGSEKLFDHCRAALGVRKDQTTPDKLFTLKKQECLGACDKAVVVQIDDDYYFNVTPEVIDKIIDDLRQKALSHSGKEGL
jgi:NADH-quinone oxidoreductase subunit E